MIYDILKNFSNSFEYEMVFRVWLGGGNVREMGRVVWSFLLIIYY